MEFKYIKLDATQHRVDIIINNPPVNILTGAVMEELISALKITEKDKAIRAVVLKGEGKAWSAGADVSEHLPGKFESMLDVFGELCELVRKYPIPTIAAVDGLCLGGGCEVAAMCDFVIASKRAKFGQPEIKVGVIPPVACAHFPRGFGVREALEIILTGDIFDADYAYHLRMVTKVVPVESFDDDVNKFVAKITSNSGAVLRIAKLAAVECFQVNPERATRGVDDMYRRDLMKTKDAVEGLTAFMEKRDAYWQDE